MNYGIYHRKDLDGYASGAIMLKRWPGITLIGYHYGDPIDIEMFRGARVIMADVSLPPDQMAELSEVADFFAWIDHHKSAIESVLAHPYFDGTVNGIQLVGIAACELTWEYAFPEVPVPRTIRLLGDYDVWRNENQIKWLDVILPFQYGMRLKCQSPETFPMYLLEDHSVENMWMNEKSITMTGKDILTYQSRQNEINAGGAFLVNFMGLRGIAMNTTEFNSNAFLHVYDPSQHDVMIPFRYEGNKWRVSLYTTKDEVDCATLAQANGGGGHAKAAGFTLTDIDKIIKP